MRGIHNTTYAHFRNNDNNAKPIVRVPSLVTTLLVHSSKIRSIYGDAFVRLPW